jgi:hypothetical protein
MVNHRHLQNPRRAIKHSNSLLRIPHGLKLIVPVTLGRMAIRAISASGNDGGAIEVPNIITGRSRFNILAQALR